MDIDVNQLPIPDFGLTCPQCEYPLRGLPAHRCPECGAALDIPSLIRPWTRLRPPHYTGADRPLPDFGLLCDTCETPLAGALDDACGACGRSFDLDALAPPRQWFILDAALAGPLPIPGVQALLAEENVPHVPVTEKSVAEIYGGHGVLSDRLRVPSEFFFEVLWLLAQAKRDAQAARDRAGQDDWTCTNCGEENPGNFDVCWNCEQTHPSTNHGGA